MNDKLSNRDKGMFQSTVILYQDLSSKARRLVVIDTEEYESKIESILQDRSQYCQVEIDPSQELKSNVIDWADQYLSKSDIDDVTYKFIIVYSK